MYHNGNKCKNIENRDVYYERVFLEIPLLLTDKKEYINKNMNVD